MVNTFLVDSNFVISAKCLDNKRLFKQCLEAKHIIEILEGKRTGFKHHPATQQWIGYLPALKYYFNVHLQEIRDRGKVNTTMTPYEVPSPNSHPLVCLLSSFSV